MAKGFGHKYTFVRVANNTTNGVAIGVEDRDIVVYKIIIGTPVASADIRLYDIVNPVNEATTNQACHVTLPATLPTTGARLVEEINFGEDGIVLGEGGNIMCDQDCQLTVVWDYLD